MTRLIICMLLLIVTQAAPPVPRQATENQNAPKPQQVQCKADDATQNAQQQASAPDNPPTQTTNGKIGEDGQVKQGCSVSVSKLPTVSVADSNWWGPSVFPAVVYDVLTFLLVAVGFCGIRYAIRTLRAIQRQAAIMEKQLTIPYRAYLGIMEPEQPINERGVGSPRTHAMFPVVNNGHVRARIVSVDVEVVIQIQGNDVYRSSAKETVSDHGEIPPEKVSSYAVNVYWTPKFPNADAIIVSVDVEYETGFKEVGNDTMSFVRVFKPMTQKWTTGYGGVDVDVTKKNDGPN